MEIMQLDLNDEETLAFLHLLVEIIKADRYPFPPRIQVLRGILAKLLPRAREIYRHSGEATALCYRDAR
jgi:hypothetical protein